MADPKQSPTCYLDVEEFAAFVGGVAQSDWPTALRFMQAASRQIDNRTHRFFFQLEATDVDMNVKIGQRDFIPPYDLLAAPTGLALDLDGDLTYSEDLIAAGALVIPLGTAAPFYGFEVLDVGLAARTKVLRVTADWGWPRESELTADTIQDDPLSASATTITVTASGNFEVGQTLTLESNTLGSEQVLVTDLPSPTTLTVRRGINGTTAASHVQASAIYRLRWPHDIYIVTGAVAARLWRKRDVAFASVHTDEGPRVPSGEVLDKDDLERLGPYIRRDI